MKDLILLRGLPGSGKSTLADVITDVKTNIFSADMYFEDAEGNYKFDAFKIRQAHEWCRNSVEEKMKWKKSPIVVANTFTQEWEMKTYELLAETYGYNVHSVIVENRHDGINVHGVPVDKLEQMKNRFEIKL